MEKTGRQILEFDKKAGAMIRAIRLKNRLSQEKLALGAEITFQQIQKYERGVNRITLGKLNNICKTLGLKTSQFIKLVEACDD